MLENHGINKQRFIKRAGEVIAYSQKSYNLQKQIIAESGDSLKLDMQEIMSQPFKNAFDRFDKKTKEKYNWRVDVEGDIKNEIPPYEDILNEILKELIVNATEAMKNGGDIVMHVRKEENQFVIELKNNGPAISKKDLEHIFEKGFTTKKTGTGHGLFYNKEFIEKIMNGSFEVETQKDKGTKFIIKIPI